MVNFRTFISPWEKTCVSISSYSPTSPVPQPLTTINLLSVPIDLPALNISDARSHRKRSLLWLSFFTGCNDLKVHLCFSTYWDFISLPNNILYFTFQFMSLWALGHLFKTFALTNSVTMNIIPHYLLGTHARVSLGWFLGWSCWNVGSTNVPLYKLMLNGLSSVWTVYTPTSKIKGTIDPYLC